MRSSAPLLSRSATAGAHLRQDMRGVGHLRDFRRLPALAFILVRDSDNGAVRLHRQQIEDAIVVSICYGDRLNRMKCSQAKAARGIVPAARS